MLRLPRASVIAGGGVVIVVAALLLTAVETGKTPEMKVIVADRPVEVAHSATVGAVASRFRLRPRAGDLLDVRGKLLRRAVFPGGFAVNGRRVSGRAQLHGGDRVVPVAGRDQRESQRRTVVAYPAGLPSDPQFYVDRVPGVLLVTRGAVSHELVSSRFKATGTAKPERAVALTFDDGPSPDYTPRILAELNKLHVDATFFVIGYLAKAYPSLVRREVRMGMAVGNHSYNHPDVPPFQQLPRPLIRDEIALNDQLLARLGVDTRLFRPPGGGTSAQVVRIAAALGQRVVLWSVDPADWQPGVTAKQVAKRVLAKIGPGSIVEMHDGGGNRSATLKALPAIVRGVRARHLRLVKLPSGSGPVIPTAGSG
jgi:peptidoglycan-N-acetylglucosamine deacetylase